MITLHVILANTTSVNLITELGRRGFTSAKIDNVICEQSLRVRSHIT